MILFCPQCDWSNLPVTHPERDEADQSEEGVQTWGEVILTEHKCYFSREFQLKSLPIFIWSSNVSKAGLKKEKKQNIKHKTKLKLKFLRCTSHDLFCLKRFLHFTLQGRSVSCTRLSAIFNESVVATIKVCLFVSCTVGVCLAQVSAACRKCEMYCL